MKSMWLNIICIIILVVVCFFFWKSCKSDNSTAADIAAKTKTNDSLIAISKIRDTVDIHRNAQIRFHDSITGKTIDSLTRILFLQKDTLKSTRRSLRSLSARVDEYVNATGDTTLKLAYDSLQRELEMAYRLVDAYSESSDTTIRVLTEEGKYKDSVITVLNNEIVDLKRDLTTALENFDGLKKDTDKLSRKLKNRTFLSRIGVTIAAILGTLLILKK